MHLSSQKILRIIISAVVGLIAGATLGFVLGGLFGGMVSMFSNELSDPASVRIIGLLLGAGVGAIIGGMMVALGGRLLNSDDKPLFGILIGIILGALVGFRNWDADLATEISFSTMIFAGSVGLSAGAIAGLASAIFIAARAPEGNTTVSEADKQQDDQFASFMKERLKK